ncbi:MAG: guanylate kinase [Candidatus Marinimicrobia bacterium]|nr:guanylate kinase [Candidatus Neomarinimicrobiota bacterium]
MKNFIAISAPSGAGKTTICRELQRRIPGIKFSLSYTTRPKRSIETDGVDYIFISDEKFKTMIAAAEFAEFEEVHGYYYGTPKIILEDTIAANQKMLFEVDVKGAVALKQLYPDNTITVFIMPPDIDTLTKRLKNRGTDDDVRIKKRLERIAIEMTYKDRFDYSIINDDIDRATQELIKIIL